MKTFIISLLCALVLPAVLVHADGFELTDLNGDGTIRFLAFGDSITFGIGDTQGIGYPGRLETMIGLLVDNEGDPGEVFLNTGVNRLGQLLQNSAADYVLLMEGANDARSHVDGAQMEVGFQKSINAAQALGKTPILMTLPPPCCEHGGLTPSTESYGRVMLALGEENSIPVVNLRKAWITTCTSIGECQLYNLPEGLHPNAQGYLVMAQTIAATLFNIDIFAEGGAADLEGALGLPEGTVIVKPEPAPAEESN
ncbi:MAG: SGNH/GDSL hydrolase family protein [Oligoflexia bacterium]|nr:SGNH/GDSL hydrolase family protein [Oligoflexia bacterium]